MGLGGAQPLLLVFQGLLKGGVLGTLAWLCRCPLTDPFIPPQLQGHQAAAWPRGVRGLAELQGGQASAGAG